MLELLISIKSYGGEPADLGRSCAAMRARHLCVRALRPLLPGIRENVLCLLVEPDQRSRNPACQDLAKYHLLSVKRRVSAVNRARAFASYPSSHAEGHALCMAITTLCSGSIQIIWPNTPSAA